MSEVVQQLLDELEAELKAQQLWASQAPDATSLSSTLPFCYDTLKLEQWLQFIFLPRLQALLDAQHALPTKVSILPMAELAFNDSAPRPAILLNIIRRIDNILSGVA
ncbi:YqcC family protein [Rheinheimera pleomorphica]|uniref:YqcC family protein n=1 Tax=Rheinheimera pleomorphica TaxID=2703963 RepID=UPI00141FEBCC|nr:YqcC family protein [Rheinheimera pleomorphica]